MKLVIQRVTQASVNIDGEEVSAIKAGLLVLIGVHINDSLKDIDWYVNKLVNMRIFNDDQGKMNLSLKDIQGELLLVSQFTLNALCEKGNRPSFIEAARPEQAIPIYEAFIRQCRQHLGEEKVKTGVFGADMKVRLLNDGPVTIIL